MWLARFRGSSSTDRRIRPSPLCQQTVSTAQSVVKARRLRALYVMHTAASSGSVRSLRSLVKSLPPDTVEPYVLCPDGYAVQLLEDARISRRTIPGVSMFWTIRAAPLRGFRLVDLARTFWFMRYGSVLRKAIHEFRPDLVHLNDWGMFHAAAIARRAGVPIVMHARTVADRENHWVLVLIKRLFMKYVARVIAIDESVRLSLRGLALCDVIYNPLDSTTGSVGVRRPPVSGAEPPVRVSFLANLLAYKGIWDLLESARILRERADIVFQIAGGNSRPREFYGTWCGRLASLLRLASDVERAAQEWIVRERLERRVLMRGHVDDIDKFLGSTDILVFPSHLNGLGRSVFEAGVRGIPAIVTLADRVEDIVEDGVTGLIVPEGDPTSLAMAIERLADDSKLRARLGWNAQRKYRLQFDSERIGLEMLDVYRSLLGAAAPDANT